MKIYGFPTFNVSKCTLTAEFAGVDYEYVAVDPQAGEHKLPEHMARHPLGKVPAIELEDGRPLFESGAICRYIGRVSDSGMYSGDAYRLGLIDEWMDFANQHIGRWMAVFFFQERVSHGVFGRPIDHSAIEEAQGWLDQQLPALEAQLSRQDYLAGDDITIADTFTAAFIQIHEETTLDLSGYVQTLQWFGRLRSNDAYSRAMAHFPNGRLAIGR